MKELVKTPAERALFQLRLICMMVQCGRETEANTALGKLQDILESMIREERKGKS